MPVTSNSNRNKHLGNSQFIRYGRKQPTTKQLLEKSGRKQSVTKQLLEKSGRKQPTTKQAFDLLLLFVTSIKTDTCKNLNMF